MRAGHKRGGRSPKRLKTSSHFGISAEAGHRARQEEIGRPALVYKIDETIARTPSSSSARRAVNLHGAPLPRAQAPFSAASGLLPRGSCLTTKPAEPAGRETS
mmetsp:Transcript_52946/g.106256  ORF Transcript_52946/g.106256 Transcript_52946/m.106256 type:complete len:103 (+) Transcript_52946:98-406(+)